MIFKDRKVKVADSTEKSIAKKLKGIIKWRDKHRLLIRFWDIQNENSKDKYKGNDSIVNSDDNKKDFVYVIDTTKWKRSVKFFGLLPSNKCFDIPFRFNQFMATSIPFRIMLDSGDNQASFLNANMAYLFVFGSTRIYESEFVMPRNRYWAIGPYLGLSSLENPVTDKEEFALTYGANVVGSIHGLNLTVAFGGQNGFKNETNEVKYYIGFGIGFKLFETYTPEIKNKDE
jgi:hypothetical protein